MNGKCNCGKVSFEVASTLSSMYKCYCTLCQKQSGTASNAATIVAESDFKWLTGEDAVTVWKKESGFNSHFCSTCGSPVPNPIGKGYVWIPLGLIENLDSTVVVKLFEDDRPRWEAQIEIGAHSVNGVGDVDELFDVLSGHVST